MADMTTFERVVQHVPDNGPDEIEPVDQLVSIALLLAEAYRMKDQTAVDYLLRKNVEAVTRLDTFDHGDDDPRPVV